MSKTPAEALEPYRRYLEVLARVHLDPRLRGKLDLSFSPDGRTLVTGSADGTLKLWDLPAIRHELATLGLDW